MTPQIALVILLTIVCFRPFFESRDVVEKMAAQERGGYTGKPGSLVLLYLLLLPVALGLWWYYALATDQILLGVIPTVGFVISSVTLVIEAKIRRNA